MRKYADPLLLGQYLKYLHEHVSGIDASSEKIHRLLVHLVGSRCGEVRNVSCRWCHGRFDLLSGQFRSIRHTW